MSDSNDHPNQPEPESDAVCPECGSTLPSVSEKGRLCPRCLMAAAMAATQDGETEPQKQRPEPPEIAAVQAAFPQLEILDVIGVGGMGVVYKAKQTSLNRFVALKLLAPHREAEPGFAERFTREAQALAALNHPNIVTVHDFGQAGGFFYLLMEYIDGVNLREAMKAGRFTPEQALAIVPPICEALQFAHDQGIVHRDIKPENLLMDKQGRVMVADFGIARILDQNDATSASNNATETVDPGLTVGTSLGTPKYMAPEQAEHPERADHRADIYSLGVVFYEMLTGETPATALTPPSKRVEIDVRLDEVVLRALEGTPERRWQSATDLRTQVETIVSTSSVESGQAPPPLDLGDDSAPVTANSKPHRKKGNGPLWLAVALAVPGVPLAMFGVFMLVGVLKDPDWNPTPPEAFVTFGSWVGAAILLCASFLSFYRWLRRESENERPRRHWGISVPAMVGLLLLLAAGIGLLSFDVFQPTAALAQDTRAAEALAVEQTDPVQHERADQLEAQLSILPIVVICIAIIAFLVGGFVLLAKASKGAALGCGVLVVLAVIAGIAVVAVYLFSARPMSESTPTVEMFEFDTNAESVVGIRKAALTQQANGISVFSGEIDVRSKPVGWDFWVTTRAHLNAGNGPTTSESASKKVSQDSTFQAQLGSLAWSDSFQADVDAKFEELRDITFTPHPNSPSTIFSFTDAIGKYVIIFLELRPESTSTDSLHIE